MSDDNEKLVGPVGRDRVSAEQLERERALGQVVKTIGTKLAEGAVIPPVDHAAEAEEWKQKYIDKVVECFRLKNEMRLLKEKAIVELMAKFKETMDKL